MSSPPRRGCFRGSDIALITSAVFPASAGVFLRRVCEELISLCLPRLGGGVSQKLTSIPCASVSSPPRRGCFHTRPSPSTGARVFPASAGVFPCRMCCARRSKGLPRLGGGVSQAPETSSGTLWSSPPRRGCFPSLEEQAKERRVFPASAGVCLPAARSGELLRSLPRLGGGVSFLRKSTIVYIPSSPPRRGCFHCGSSFRASSQVFPASAGVFLPMR